MICFLCAFSHVRPLCICSENRRVSIQLVASAPDLHVYVGGPSSVVEEERVEAEASARSSTSASSPSTIRRRSSMASPSSTRPSRLPLLLDRPGGGGGRSSSVPPSGSELDIRPARQSSLRQSATENGSILRSPHRVSVESTSSPLSRRSSVRRRAEERRKNEIPTTSSGSEGGDEVIRAEAERLVQDLNPSRVDDLLQFSSDDDVSAIEERRRNSLEEFEMMERLHLGSLDSPTELPEHLAAPVDYFADMERFIADDLARSGLPLMEGEHPEDNPLPQPVDRNERIAQWMEGVSPMEDEQGPSEAEGSRAQIHVVDLLRGLAQTASGSNGHRAQRESTSTSSDSQGIIRHAGTRSLALQHTSIDTSAFPDLDGEELPPPPPLPSSAPPPLDAPPPLPSTPPPPIVRVALAEDDRPPPLPSTAPPPPPLSPLSVSVSRPAEKTPIEEFADALATRLITEAFSEERRPLSLHEDLVLASTSTEFVSVLVYQKQPVLARCEPLDDVSQERLQTPSYASSDETPTDDEKGRGTIPWRREARKAEHPHGSEEVFYGLGSLDSVPDPSLDEPPPLPSSPPPPPPVSSNLVVYTDSLVPLSNAQQTAYRARQLFSPVDEVVPETSSPPSGMSGHHNEDDRGHVLDAAELRHQMALPRYIPLQELHEYHPPAQTAFVAQEVHSLASSVTAESTPSMSSSQHTLVDEEEGGGEGEPNSVPSLEGLHENALDETSLEWMLTEEQEATWRKRQPDEPEAFSDSSDTSSSTASKSTVQLASALSEESEDRLKASGAFSGDSDIDEEHRIAPEILHRPKKKRDARYAWEEIPELPEPVTMTEMPMLVVREPSPTTSDRSEEEEEEATEYRQRKVSLPLKIRLPSEEKKEGEEKERKEVVELVYDEGGDIGEDDLKNGVEEVAEIAGSSLPTDNAATASAVERRSDEVYLRRLPKEEKMEETKGRRSVEDHDAEPPEFFAPGFPLKREEEEAKEAEEKLKRKGEDEVMREVVELIYAGEEDEVEEVSTSTSPSSSSAPLVPDEAIESVQVVTDSDEEGGPFPGHKIVFLLKRESEEEGRDPPVEIEEIFDEETPSREEVEAIGRRKKRDVEEEEKSEDSDEEIIRAVEQRSNEYYFKSGGSRDGANDEDEEDHLQSSSGIEDEPTMHRQAGEEEIVRAVEQRSDEHYFKHLSVGALVDLEAEDEEEEKREEKNQESAKTPMKSTIDYDAIAQEVERRSNELYFGRREESEEEVASEQEDMPKEKVEMKENTSARSSDNDVIALAVERRSDEHFFGRRNETEKPTSLPTDSDDIAMAVERRSDEYFFGESGPSHLGIVEPDKTKKKEEKEEETTEQKKEEQEDLPPPPDYISSPSPPSSPAKADVKTVERSDEYYFNDLKSEEPRRARNMWGTLEEEWAPPPLSLYDNDDSFTRAPLVRRKAVEGEKPMEKKAEEPEEKTDVQTSNLPTYNDAIALAVERRSDEVYFGGIEEMNMEAEEVQERREAEEEEEEEEADSPGPFALDMPDVEDEGNFFGGRAEDKEKTPGSSGASSSEEEVAKFVEVRSNAYYFSGGEEAKEEDPWPSGQSPGKDEGLEACSDDFFQAPERDSPSAKKDVAQAIEERSDDYFFSGMTGKNGEKVHDEEEKAASMEREQDKKEEEIPHRAETFPDYEGVAQSVEELSDEFYFGRRGGDKKEEEPPRKPYAMPSDNDAIAQLIEERSDEYYFGSGDRAKEEETHRSGRKDTEKNTNEEVKRESEKNEEETAQAIEERSNAYFFNGGKTDKKDDSPPSPSLPLDLDHPHAVPAQPELSPKPAPLRMRSDDDVIAQSIEGRSDEYYFPTGFNGTPSATITRHFVLDDNFLNPVSPLDRFVPQPTDDPKESSTWLRQFDQFLGEPDGVRLVSSETRFENLSPSEHNGVRLVSGFDKIEVLDLTPTDDLVSQAIENRSNAYYGLDRISEEEGSSFSTGREEGERLVDAIEDTGAAWQRKLDQLVLERSLVTDAFDEVSLRPSEGEIEKRSNEYYFKDDEARGALLEEPDRDGGKSSREAQNTDTTSTAASSVVGAIEVKDARMDETRHKEMEEEEEDPGKETHLHLPHYDSDMPVPPTPFFTEDEFSRDITIAIHGMTTAENSAPSTGASAPRDGDGIGRHPPLIRLGGPSLRGSLDRQSSLANSVGTDDELDRTSLLRLKLENNLERATTSHGERLEEVRVEEVEHFWDYRYNKSPRTMQRLNEARERAERLAREEAERMVRAQMGSRASNCPRSPGDREVLLEPGARKSHHLAPPSDGQRTEASSPSNLSNISRLSSEEDDDGLHSKSTEFFHLESASSESVSSVDSLHGEGSRVKRGKVVEIISPGTALPLSPPSWASAHLADGRDRDSAHGRSPGAYSDIRTTPLGHHNHPTTQYYSIRRASSSASNRSSISPPSYLHYSGLSMEKGSQANGGYQSRWITRSSVGRDSLLKPSASTDRLSDIHNTRKSVSFRQRVDELIHTPPLLPRKPRAAFFHETTITRHHQLRSILKREHASNLLHFANANLLRELEQFVAERDRLNTNINATPADVSTLSPATGRAQTRYRECMIEQREKISIIIENKFATLLDTLKPEEMPSWMSPTMSSGDLTFIGYAHKRNLLRRQSSFFSQLEGLRNSGKSGDIYVINECARKLDSLRSQLARRDSEIQIELSSDNAGDLLSRITQRLNHSPVRDL